MSSYSVLGIACSHGHATKFYSDMVIDNGTTHSEMVSS